MTSKSPKWPETPKKRPKGAKMAQNSPVGPFLDHFRPILARVDPFWAILGHCGPFWAILDPFWALFFGHLQTHLRHLEAIGDLCMASIVALGGPKVTNSRTFDPILVQNGSKKGPKMGPKMGLPEGGTKKKVEKYFYLALLWGVIGGPL